MNRDQFLGRWHEMKGKVKERWGKLTDDDIAQINGKWEQLAGKLQKRYGWAKEQAEREMNNWCTSCEQKKGWKSEEGMGQRKENSGYHEKERERGQHEWRPNEQPEKKHPGKVDEHKEKKRKAG